MSIQTFKKKGTIRYGANVSGKPLWEVFGYPKDLLAEELWHIP